jgi:hypothetical protein
MKVRWSDPLHCINKRNWSHKIKTWKVCLVLKNIMRSRKKNTQLIHKKMTDIKMVLMYFWYFVLCHYHSPVWLWFFILIFNVFWGMSASEAICVYPECITCNKPEVSTLHHLHHRPDHVVWSPPPSFPPESDVMYLIHHYMVSQCRRPLFDYNGYAKQNSRKTCSEWIKYTFHICIL